VSILTSVDPNEARERLVVRADWPAGDMLALNRADADPRTQVIEGGSFRLFSDEQARAIL